MQENFARVVGWVLIHEGGKVDHKKDPGGRTNRGVTQKTYDAYCDLKGEPRKDVYDISEFEVQSIYRRQYWDAVQGDRLPSGVDYAVFDYAVNSGPSRAIKHLQEVVGAKVDGHIGVATMEAVNSMPAADVVKKLCERRFAFVKSLKTWGTFGKGWTRRIMGQKIGFQSDDVGVIDRGAMLAMANEVPIPAPKEAAPGKAVDEDASITTITKDAISDAGPISWISAIGGLIGQFAAGSGPIQWAFAAVLVLGVVYGVYRLERGRLA